jgi:hypothetical protein
MFVLFVIVSVGVILYGYFLMSRLDRFIERGCFGTLPEHPVEPSVEKEILLYGDRETIEEIRQALDQASITYDGTTEPEISEGIYYHWIGAFSDDDGNNLLICLLAKRKNGQVRTMAKCNNSIYERIFRQTGITVILQNDVPPSRIIACLKG